MSHRRRTGDRWEKTAERFLTGRGLQLQERNYLCKTGEIDLVMLDGQTLVFVEVRFRSAGARLSGAQTVSTAKQLRIIRAASRYLQYHDPQLQRNCRFDVVSIGMPKGRVSIDWIRDAFRS